jgi:hypothetical protein
VAIYATAPVVSTGLVVRKCLLACLHALIEPKFPFAPKRTFAMNHLEQLVAEWLQYNGYFVRCSVQVGPRPRGGFEGELDVVGIHVVNRRMLHVECSLDGDSKARREERFSAKFERGRRFREHVFPGLPLPEELVQVALLQFPNTNVSTVGGQRLLSVREFVQEIFVGLQGTSPSSGAVSSSLPLLRTLQLAADAAQFAPNGNRLIGTKDSQNPISRTPVVSEGRR